MQFKTLLAIPAVAGALLLAPGEAQAQSKVAIVNMQKAINETNEGARANYDLKKLFDKRQVELNARQEELLKEKTGLEKRCRSMPQAQCQAGMDELQKKLLDLQNLMMQYQQDIQKRQGEATQPILTKMLAILGRMARQNGYDMVIDSVATHYAVAGLEITDQAIKIYNSESTAQPLPPEPPPKPEKGNKGGDKGKKK